MKIEVWYTNNDHRGYPMVDKDTVREGDGIMSFTFGEHKHEAHIVLSNVNFVEAMPEID